MILYFLDLLIISCMFYTISIVINNISGGCLCLIARTSLLIATTSDEKYTGYSVFLIT